MSDSPKFAQKRPSIHFNVVPQFMHLPRHKRNLWGFPKLPRLETKKGEADAYEQWFEHIDRPTKRANRNRKDQIARLAHLLAPHRAEKSRAHKDMSGVLSLDPRDSKLL
jgi:hypothetical protein